MKPGTHPSTASHPWWAGTGRVMATSGRVEEFDRRYGKPSS